VDRFDDKNFMGGGVAGGRGGVIGGGRNTRFRLMMRLVLSLRGGAMIISFFFQWMGVYFCHGKIFFHLSIHDPPPQ